MIASRVRHPISHTVLAWSRFVLACLAAMPTITAPLSQLREDGTLKSQAGHFGVLVLFLASGLGCSPSVRMPRLHNPGPASYQQYNATQYADPYPLPDAGPEVVGARPRNFQVPRAEVERARLYTQQRQQSQFVAPAPQPIYHGQ